MLPYELGDMRGDDGVVLRIEVEKFVSEHALLISDKVKKMPLYKSLAGRIRSPRVLLYLQFAISEEIMPFVRQACVIRFYKRKGRQLAKDEESVCMPKSGIYTLLKECWSFDDIPCNFTSPLHSHVLKAWYSAKDRSRDLSNKLSAVENFFRNRYEDQKHGGESGNIACYYAEGVDLSRRTDIGWHPGSKIDPKRIVIYIDRKSLRYEKRLSRKAIQDIERMGFRWVALEKDVIEGESEFYRIDERIPAGMPARMGTARQDAERWLVKTWNRMLKEVYYWRSFYDKFNIKVHFIPHEGLAKNIAQAIAFDISEGNRGVLVGRQRSEIFMPLCDNSLGYHPKHVFFIWNRRTQRYLRPNCDMIESVVITGYVYDIFRADKTACGRPADILRSQGAGFIVALFDNMHGSELHFSTKNMADFYMTFLRWVLENPTAGLVIKSKKPYVIEKLPMIRGLLEEAVDTGRCINLKNTHGMYPFEASSGADMAVGCGISTAVMEAVVGGGKGVHYDMMHLKNHEFYRWGYERVIFDDLNRMMAVLNEHMRDRTGKSLLGDWSQWPGEIDAFNDSKGAQRIGCYIKWLLDSFDNGKDRREAINAANSLYRKTWGEDKAFEMHAPPDVNIGSGEIRDLSVITERS